MCVSKGITKRRKQKNIEENYIGKTIYFYIKVFFIFSISFDFMFDRIRIDKKKDPKAHFPGVQSSNKHPHHVDEMLFHYVWFQQFINK